MIVSGHGRERPGMLPALVLALLLPAAAAKDRPGKRDTFESPAHKCASMPPGETLAQSISRFTTLRDTTVGLQNADKSWPTQDRCMLSNDWHRMANPIARALEIHGLGVPGGHVYEFGVYGGGTMLSLWRLLRPSKIWGLDSFKGLPQHTVEKVKGWSGGAYSKDPRKALTVKMGEMNVGFVPGFYNDSLTDTLVEELGMWPAMYFGIDCDLYVSTVPALDWGLRSRIIVPGTMVGYDDWWVLPCGKGNEALSPLDVGEGRAHAEMAIKYDVEFMCAAGPCAMPESKGCDKHRTWGPIFVVLSIGQGRGTHGFNMNDDDVRSFKTYNSVCKGHHSEAYSLGG